MTKERKEYLINYRIVNRERIKKSAEEYRKNHKDDMIRYREMHKEELKEKRKIYQQKHKTQISDSGKTYYDNNKERIRIYGKNRQKEVATYTRNKRKTDICFRIEGSLRTRIRKAIKGVNRSKSTLKLLGCSMIYVRKYIESKFTKGMSWSNYGLYGWHIDHIRPCASFDLSKPNEQRKCFHYTNLQPLWAVDNLTKSSKILK